MGLNYLSSMSGGQCMTEIVVHACAVDIHVLATVRILLLSIEQVMK